MTLNRLRDLESVLERAELRLAPHAKLLERVRRFLHRYAELERELLGGIRIAVPRHLLEQDEGPPEDLVERLADRTAKAWNWPSQGDREVMTMLDHEGLKVYRPPFPKGSDLQGFFVFDEEVGPAFVVDGRLPCISANTVFAQLYGHYLMDLDPYEIQLVLAGRSAASPRSLRSRHFAVAFLVGRTELLSYLRGLGWKPGDPVPQSLLEHLSVFFEVDTATVAARLLSLGLLDAAGVADLDLGSAPAGSKESAVPDRFVRLALEAYARRRLTAEELAQYLETDVRSALRLASQFAVPDLDSASPGS
jgi:hypothetical protein